MGQLFQIKSRTLQIHILQHQLCTRYKQAQGAHESMRHMNKHLHVTADYC